VLHREPGYSSGLRRSGRFFFEFAEGVEFQVFEDFFVALKLVHNRGGTAQGSKGINGAFRRIDRVRSKMILQMRAAR
jgi:hypothetical protein